MVLLTSMIRPMFAVWWSQNSSILIDGSKKKKKKKRQHLADYWGFMNITWLMWVLHFPHLRWFAAFGLHQSQITEGSSVEGADGISSPLADRAGQRFNNKFSKCWPAACPPANQRNPSQSTAITKCYLVFIASCNYSHPLQRQLGPRQLWLTLGGGEEIDR